MKKVVSAALALVMIFMLGAVAFAANEDATFNIPVYYTTDVAGAEKPAVTFTLTVSECKTATGSTATKADAPTFASNTANVAFEASTKEEDVGFAEFTVQASSFKKAGIFTYEITQSVDNDYAGLTVDETKATLTVYVIQGATAGDFSAKVKVEYSEDKVSGGKYNEDSKKYEPDDNTSKAGETFTNTYEAAAIDPDPENPDEPVLGFNVSKVVEGELGDKTKAFKINVSFESAKKVAPNAIAYKYVDPQSKEEKTQYVAMAYDSVSKTYKGTKAIELAHGGTFCFDNVPYGVVYTVVEDSASAGDYEVTYTPFDDSAKLCTGKIATPAVNVVVTNTEPTQVDTGVVMDFLPYVLVLAFVGAACVMLVFKKRKAEDF